MLVEENNTCVKQGKNIRGAVSATRKQMGLAEGEGGRSSGVEGGRSSGVEGGRCSGRGAGEAEGGGRLVKVG